MERKLWNYDGPGCASILALAAAVAFCGIRFITRKVKVSERN